MEDRKELCIWDNGKVIPVVFYNLSDATGEEARAYVEYVKARGINPDRLDVRACSDGKVDVMYETNGAKFERIRRITGK